MKLTSHFLLLLFPCLLFLDGQTSSESSLLKNNPLDEGASTSTSVGYSLSPYGTKMPKSSEGQEVQKEKKAK
ncbi:hypothetical protein HMI56_004755 [Coelomomyces lativittatus]|nr:hypothetical protein HMI56_004755 [Coelomomyces lativittatus]